LLNGVQFGAVPPVHTPAWHVSPTRQTLLLHAVPFDTGVRMLQLPSVPAGLQLAVLHWFPAPEQLTGGPGWQLPPEQASPTVHALPSLHATVLLLF